MIPVAAKELSEWVEIGTGVSVEATLHTIEFAAIHRVPWLIRNCLTILVCKRVITEKSVMLKQLVTLLQIGSRDFWRICNSVLNRGKSTIPPLFNGPEVHHIH